MAIVSRRFTFVLPVVGIALVFLGLTRALWITPHGVLVSLAAIHSNHQRTSSHQP